MSLISSTPFIAAAAAAIPCPPAAAAHKHRKDSPCSPGGSLCFGFCFSSVSLLFCHIINHSDSLFVLTSEKRKEGRKEGRREQERWENAAASCTATRPDRSAPEIITAPRIRTSRGRESMSFWHDAISRVRRSKAYLIASLMSLLVKASLHAKSVLKVAMACIMKMDENLDRPRL